MKLYFYFLEDSYYTGVKPYIRLEECEVVEKPKTYKPVNETPRGYYYCSVKKEDIGKISGSLGNAVVLLEKNNKRAAEIFKEKSELLILETEEAIKRAKKSIARLRQIIKAIEEWEEFVNGAKKEKD